MRLTQVRVQHFKAFESFSLRLGANAFLVGPNNAGKSTLVAAVRTASRLLAHAARRKPTIHRGHGRIATWAHELSAERAGLVDENLRHQFRDKETSLSLATETGLIITAVWPPEDDEDVDPRPFFYVTDEERTPITQPRQVLGRYEPIGIIPGLYPVNRIERVLNDEYIAEQAEGRRASQHTRNHLRLIDLAGEMKAFRKFALEWLPELVDLLIDERPGDAPGEHLLDVFLRERGDRIPKEIFWSGDGVQVFVQLLAHLWRLRDAAVIVLDEPDLYLHADLQRRLVRLLESCGAQVITATHSPEMLGEASADSVIWVDKSRTHGVKRPDASTLEDLAGQIGSGFNLRLATALRSRVVLFVEGDDMSVLRHLARTVGASALAEERACSVIGMTGFSHWVHVEPFRWLQDHLLEGSVEIFVVLDRDFRPDAEVRRVEQALRGGGVHAHVWRRKELESYLIELAPIARATSMKEAELSELLAEVTEGLAQTVKSQLVAKQVAGHHRSKDDPATVIERVLRDIEQQADDPGWRLLRFPAKEIISGLNGRLQAMGCPTVSPQKLARTIHEDELAAEITELLREIETHLPSR